ncbi:hypothetical protein K1719_047382 [Acacia pycnantha]|nr:hypothetical protein K1719_047382 [Acacia pycnantha]
MEWSTCYVDVIFGAFGILMYFGQREEKHPCSSIIKEHNHGIDPNGRNFDPPLFRTSSSNKQHLQCQEATQRHHGAHGEFMVALKYVTLLTIFLFSFFCHSLSIRFRNQVNILTNTPQDPTPMVTPQYIHGLLEKGFILNTLGNRLFYVAIPPGLDLWSCLGLPVFLHYHPCSLQSRPSFFMCQESQQGHQ